MTTGFCYCRSQCLHFETLLAGQAQDVLLHGGHTDRLETVLWVYTRSPICELGVPIILTSTFENARSSVSSSGAPGFEWGPTVLRMSIPSASTPQRQMPLDARHLPRKLSSSCLPSVKASSSQPLKPERESEARERKGNGPEGIHLFARKHCLAVSFQKS